MSAKIVLSEKDRKFREFSLNGSMWKVVLQVGTPLAIYESINQLFKILDTLMAAHIGSDSVSAVAYLSQIICLYILLGLKSLLELEIIVPIGYIQSISFRETQ